MDSETPPQKKNQQPASVLDLHCLEYSLLFCHQHYSLLIYLYIITIMYLMPNIFARCKNKGGGISKPQIFFMNEHILHDMTLINQQFLSEK